MSTQRYTPPGDEKPLPTISETGVPFWEGAHHHEVRVQACQDCGKQQFPPRLLCMHCGSRHVQWHKVSGRARVYSFTVINRAPEPAFLEDVPYVVAVVELEGGGRLMTNVIGCKPEDVRCDMLVEPVFEDINDTVTLIKFRPAP